MIVSPSYYYGLPDSHVDAMEAIAQATVDEMLSLARRIWERLPNSKSRSFGDIDFSIRADTVEEPTEHGAVFKRLRITDHSSGWWAVLQWGHLYERTVTAFWFHARGDKIPKMDWEKFRDDWSYSRCRLHMQARKSDGGWYAPVHTLDYKHPLLFQLYSAIEELEEEATEVVKDTLDRDVPPLGDFTLPTGEER